MKSDFDLAGPHWTKPDDSWTDDPGPTLNVRGNDPPSLHGIFEVGDVLEDCRLITKLGYGSSGQAFLARELALADRPIVLKIAADNHEEHLKLARLQHTNIMPLFWARTICPNGVRVMAMPYLAKTTLADLLRILEASPITTWNGQRVFDALQEEQRNLPVRLAAEDQHPAQVLKHSTWVEFVVRTGQTLAEALAYAHRRNLLHLDIKPANIVVTPDGQPILLDLDVARPPITAGDTVVPWLGGTPAFMSPEQAAAMDALKKDRPIPRTVDGRSDLYSLALVLYQALGGTCDAENRPDPRRLPSVNPNVGSDLAEILAHCLAENPAQRYPDCNALADDLDRYLHDMPLHGVRNRLSERWRKWRRRRPFGLAFGGLAIGFCLACGFAGINIVRVNEERRAQAEIALADGQDWQSKGQHEAAVRRFLAGQDLAQAIFGGQALRDQLTRRLSTAQRMQLADELHKTVHLMRFEALQDETPLRMRHVLEGAGRNIWAKRALLTERSAALLEPALEKNIESQLQEFVVLWSDLQMRLAPASHKELVRAEVRQVLDQAETQFGRPFCVQLARAQSSGQVVELAELTPEAAWEFCAVGRIALAKGDVESASRYFEGAVSREPLDFGANFHAGVGWLRQKKYAEAAESLSFCLGKDTSAECLLTRGQAYAALGNLDRAMRDLDAALEKNPTLAAAYAHRAEVHTRLGRPEDAAKDLEQARRLRE